MGGGARREWALWQFCPTTEESLKNALAAQTVQAIFNALKEYCNVQLISNPHKGGKQT
jgi:hypothetical protein